MSRVMMGMMLVILALVGCSRGEEVTRENAPSGVGTITPTTEEVSEVEASGEMLPPGVVSHRLRKGEPQQVPIGTAWQVESVTMTTPTQRWRVVQERSAPFDFEDNQWYGERLRIEDVAAQTEVVVVDDIGLSGALPAYTLQLVRWSENEERLYFARSATPDGCTLLTFWEGYYELTMPSGELTELVPADPNLNAVGVSPDEKRVAHVEIETKTLVVREVDGAGEWRVELPVHGQDYTWSPQSDAIAFSEVSGICNGESVSTTIFVANLAAGTVHELATDNNRYFDIESWDSDGRILLTDRARYWLDAESGEISNDPN